MVGPERRARLVELEGAETCGGRRSTPRMSPSSTSWRAAARQLQTPSRPLRSRLRYRPRRSKRRAPDAARPPGRRIPQNAKIPCLPRKEGLFATFSPGLRDRLAAFSVRVRLGECSDPRHRRVRLRRRGARPAARPRRARRPRLRPLARAGRRRRGGLDDLVLGDATTGAGLAEALDGIEVAYYLIHGMGASPTSRRSNCARRRRSPPPRPPPASADRLSRRTGPARGTLSRHLASRLAVEGALLNAVPDRSRCGLRS